MVAVSDRVVAQTSMGFWIRGTVREVKGDGSARVRFGDFDCPPWLARTRGWGEPEEWVGPERIAPLPDGAPTEPPAVGAEVIALWDGKRFHHGTVAAVEGDGKRARVDVDFDGWERLSFGVTEVLPVLSADPSAIAAMEEKGFELGTRVMMLSGHGEDRHPGWVARLGTGRVFVRFPKASHGHWVAPEKLKPGGRARERRPPGSVADPEPGARVVGRWTDGKLYDGTVASVRDARWGREVRVAWDDGTERWTPEARVWVTEAAGERVPQRQRDEPLPDAWLEPGRVVAARAREGHWRKGTIAQRRGSEVWVDFDEVTTRKGKRTLTYDSQWARGRELAFAPDPKERRFPAGKAGVVVVTKRKVRHGYEVHSFESGRAKNALGDRLRVHTDGGAELTCAYEDVWPRDDRRPPSDTDRLSEGDQVLAERGPGLHRLAEVLRVGDRKRAGLLRVRWDDGAEQWIDPARAMPAPEPEPEPPPPPPPPPPEPEPEPEPVREDPARALLLQLVQRWTGAGGYRDGTLGRLLDDDGGGARLPVDVGLLAVRVGARGERMVLELTAATGAEEDPTPPPDGAMVRMASWVRGLFARPEDPEERARLDRAWAKATFVVDGLRVDRAGGALSVELACGEVPTATTVDGWARAVHERLFDPEPDDAR